MIGKVDVVEVFLGLGMTVSIQFIPLGGREVLKE